MSLSVQSAWQLVGSWADWAEGMMVAVESDEVGLPVTAIVGSFDQAHLHGLLRRRYSMGLPLISVIWVDTC